MKRLSRKDLELLGNRVTKAYMELPENKGRQIFRIEPELLCEQLIGLKIDYRHLSADGSILGLTAFEGVGIDLPWDDADDGVYYLDGKTVLIESDLRDSIEQSGRKNFTIAHEASHQILKMVYPREYGTRPHAQPLHFCRANSIRKRPISDWEEWQSNTLASFVLLPRFLVEQAMALFAVGSGIKILNRLFYKEDYDKFVCMSELLGCSKAALAIRMKQMGCIGQDYLDNPYRLLDVEVD